ncbi:MAG: pyruvate synthase subunit beta [Gammaproteobacteria bacterium]|nr:pyruvate synthase subunit beta [Gammaproteobacteria bacterium]
MESPETAEQQMFHSGHAACPGCVLALSLRHVLNTLGPDTMAVAAPSCAALICGAQPCSSMEIPVYQTTLESSAAAASGLRRALDSKGKRDTKVIVIAGDGGTYDIGFQALSSAVERNEDMIYFCFDNEGYMNTGGQKSSATPLYASTGSTPAGKLSKKKNLTEIMAAHEIPYAATATSAHLDDLVRKVEKAKSMSGTRVITVLIPCLPGWGLPDDAAVATSRLAVDTGVFPLYEVENGQRYTLNQTTRTRPVKDYLTTQKRYRHLSAEDFDEIQAMVDRNWERLAERAATS